MAALTKSDLRALDPGEGAHIVSLDSTAPIQITRRLMVLGFVPGTYVSVIRRAPFGDPIEFELRGGRISLRASEARLIFIS